MNQHVQVIGSRARLTFLSALQTCAKPAVFGVTVTQSRYAAIGSNIQMPLFAAEVRSCKYLNDAIKPVLGLSVDELHRDLSFGRNDEGSIV